MIRDFGEVFANFITTDGTLRPVVAFAPIGEPLVWHEDADGLTMTATVAAVEGDYEPCLLTALFPMEAGEAATKHRQKRFPAKSTSIVTVKKKIDEVVGRSGERYARFAVEVTDT